MPQAAIGTATPDAAPLRRKIAAILAADVAGYSRLVAEDEERTLRELATARRVFDGIVAASGGRIFNTAGDSVMCEFDSAVEAVRAAVAIQKALRAPGADGADARLAFRIGITIGDVVERDGDLLGDGVNIASRLEGLAPPGGICVSRSVHEAVANKIPVVFTDLGPRPVKNIPQPVHAFLIAPPREAAGAAEVLAADPRPFRTEVRPSRRSTGRTFAAAAVLVAAVGIGWTAWRFGGLPESRSPASEPAATTSRETAPPGLQASVPTTPQARSPAPMAAGKATPETSADKAIAPEKPARPVPVAPATLRDGYEAARAEEARGDRAAALKAYAALAPLVRDQVDPMLRYAALLRSRGGAEAARKSLEETARSASSRAAALAIAAQGDGAGQIGRLEAFAAANADFAPADYLLAEAYLARSGGPTLAERRLAFDALERFLDAEARLPAFFVERAVLDGWLDGARRRRAEIEAFFAGAAGRPRAHFVPTETGWSARLVLPEPASKVSLRVGEQGEALAAPAGAGGEHGSATAEIALPASTGRTTLYVAYQDAAGRDAGPFPVPFDPAAAKASAARDTLERFPESWVSFRQDLPDLLSFAQLANNRCGIAKALIGFGDEPPTQTLPLSACDPRNGPAAPDPRPLVTLPAGIDAVQVQLAYADGTESRVRTFRRP